MGGVQTVKKSRTRKIVKSPSAASPSSAFSSISNLAPSGEQEQQQEPLLQQNMEFGWLDKEQSEQEGCNARNVGGKDHQLQVRSKPRRARLPPQSFPHSHCVHLPKHDTSP